MPYYKVTWNFFLPKKLIQVFGSVLMMYWNTWEPILTEFKGAPYVLSGFQNFPKVHRNWPILANFLYKMPKSIIKSRPFLKLDLQSGFHDWHQFWKRNISAFIKKKKIGSKSLFLTKMWLLEDRVWILYRTCIHCTLTPVRLRVLLCI